MKQGTLEFQADINIPFLLIGPGTGIAPFISFLEEREALTQGKTMTRFKNLVFFGNRNKEKDFLHKELLTRLQKEEK